MNSSDGYRRESPGSHPPYDHPAYVRYADIGITAIMPTSGLCRVFRADQRGSWGAG